jgi:transposase-like protein
MHGVNEAEDQSPSNEESRFVSPRLVPYLSNGTLAHDLLDSLRWRGQVVCPRCKSKFTRQVNTNVFRRLYRCLDCGYMFNSLAGTIFQGSKMSLNKYFQFFVLHNAVQPKLALRDIGYAIDVSQKTASLLARRAEAITYSSQFARIDRAAYQDSSNGDQDGGDGDASAFFSYCEIKSIVVNDALFKQFLHDVTQYAIPDSGGDTPLS